MTWLENPTQWILGFILVMTSLGTILARKPVHSSLFFLMTLLTLASLYLQLSAQFIAVMQILVYAGAILVLFMFVIILFQDAYKQLDEVEGQSFPFFIFGAGTAFILAMIILAAQFSGFPKASKKLPDGFGMVESIGKTLYLDYFFPFEAVILIFLIAMVGALYIAKKVR